jgi:predicted alpha/beta-fold hydrolase
LEYTAPWWLPGGHTQTIWSALFAHQATPPKPEYTRVRWTSPDQDFIDVDWLQRLPHMVTAPEVECTLLVLFHGLEGTSRSHYASGFADFARALGLDFAVPHFRGCSGELNLAPRAYHSGDYAEIDWILRRFRQAHRGPMLAVGVSLGGNALLRWAQESGAQAAKTVDAVASVSAPVDLAASGHAMGRGFNRQVYTRMFLQTMKPKALQKLHQHPGLFDRTALEDARDLYAFDNVFTAPLHGFKNTEDYWLRASAKPHLHRIRVPALVLNARNDPFVPAASLPSPRQLGAYVTAWQPDHGGHVGFPSGTAPGNVRYMPYAVGQWLMQHRSHGGA